jgi:Ca2+-binding EF-hand superfamily protein
MASFLVTRVFLDAQPANEIRRVFQLIDVHKTGAITASQLQDAMESFGDRPDLAEAEAMIHEAAHTYPDKGMTI